MRVRIILETLEADDFLGYNYFIKQEVRDMSKQCDMCGKKPTYGNLVSHSNIKTRRRWEPNLQTVRAVVNGTPKRLRLCTGCLSKYKKSVGA
jgi:large subunit ribosomal protein L28